MIPLSNFLLLYLRLGRTLKWNLQLNTAKDHLKNGTGVMAYLFLTTSEYSSSKLTANLSTGKFLTNTIP